MSTRAALLIGTTFYENGDKYPNLPKAELDAIALSKILEDPQIGCFDSVHSLINESSREIMKSVDGLFKNKNADDLLLFYFAGHGERDEHGDLYLIVKETEFNFLKSTSISAKFITDVIDKSRSKRVVVILDCCYSGLFHKNVRESAGNIVGTLPAFEGNGFGRYVLTASDTFQRSWEGDKVFGKIENSIFTHHLVQGLKTGEADIDQTGLITIDNLYNFVYKEVVSKSSKQKPCFSSYKQEGKLWIAKNLHHEILPSDIKSALESQIFEIQLGGILALVKLTRGDNKRLALIASQIIERFSSYYDLVIPSTQLDVLLTKNHSNKSFMEIRDWITNLSLLSDYYSEDEKRARWLNEIEEMRSNVQRHTDNYTRLKQLSDIEEIRAVVGRSKRQENKP